MDKETVQISSNWSEQDQFLTNLNFKFQYPLKKYYKKL